VTSSLQNESEVTPMVNLKKRDKLILTGGAFLLLGFCLGPLLDALFGDSGERGRTVAAPSISEEENQRELANLAGADIPEHLKVTEKYLTNRWGHLGEVPLVATGTTPEGQTWVRDTNVIVGRDGDGKKIYAHGFHMAHKFTGTTIRVGNRPDGGFLGSRATASGVTFSPAARRDSERMPLDQLPGSGFGRKPASGEQGK